MTISGRATTSAVMLAIFAGMVAIASTYPPQARFMPYVVGIPGILLCAIQLILDLRESRRAAPAGESPVRRELFMFGWLLAFLAGIVLFGFVYATPILLFAFLRYAASERTRVALTGAAAGFALIYLVFVVLLEIPLHDGLIAAWLG
jgi:Tripartite tricarboxylate transporter TctB family